MNATRTYPQAYRTTCIPSIGDRFSDIIPREYIGRRLEAIVFPQCEETEYNEETLQALQESEDIASGKVKTKRYKTVEEMNADIDAEEDD